MACLLAAGLEGIKENLTPPECIDRNIFEMTKEEKKKKKI